MKIGIGAIFKNEALYIIEWLAHYRLMGIRDFFIANNDSSDETEIILKLLQDNGYLKYFNIQTKDSPPQLLAYSEIIEKYSSSVDWLGFLDADEFIDADNNNSQIRDFPELLGKFSEDESTGAIVLNWSIYGSNRLNFYEKKPVQERFISRAKHDLGVNRHYKTFFKTKCLESVGNNPHYFVMKENFKTLHANGECVEDYEGKKGLSNDIIWSPFKLKHYVVKSKEEFILKKYRNGSAATIGRIKGEKYFYGHDINDENGSVDPGYLILLKNEIRRIENDIFKRNILFSPMFFDEKIDVYEFFENKSLIDTFSLENDIYYIKGWSSALSLFRDMECYICFGSENYHVDYDIVRRFDIFDKKISKNSLCGFSIKINKKIIDDNGFPKEIVFFDKNKKIELIFPDIFRR